MQYIESTTDDLKSGYSTYGLRCDDKEINFFAYTGETALGDDKQLNSYHRGYFLRKGFSDAILNADPSIMKPIYKDNAGNEVSIQSTKEAVALIYDNKLNISGFRFEEGITKEQKEEAFAAVINSFVQTSKNLDFSSEKNLFMVNGNHSRVIYNNGGHQSTQIKGADVQERLGLKTQDVIMEQTMRSMMQQRKFRGL